MILSQRTTHLLLSGAAASILVGARGIDVAVKDADGKTPLDKAVEQGRVTIAKLLRAHGAVSHDVRPKGPTYDAAEAGDIAGVSSALLGGGSTEETDDNGNTALSAASQNGHAAAVATLCAAGATVSARNSVGRLRVGDSGNASLAPT